MSGSSPARSTVAVAELAMQRIVVPRDKSLYTGSSPVGHISMNETVFLTIDISSARIFFQRRNPSLRIRGVVSLLGP